MASSSNEQCGGGGMGVGRNICISKICSTRFQFWSNPPPLFLFGLCKNLLPGLWPGSTSVQWRRRRRIWGKGRAASDKNSPATCWFAPPSNSYPLFSSFPLLFFSQGLVVLAQQWALLSIFFSLLPRLFSLGESFWSGKQACWPLEHDPIVANGKHV